VDWHIAIASADGGDGCHGPPTSIVGCLRRKIDLPLPEPVNGAILTLKPTGDLANVGPECSNGHASRRCPRSRDFETIGRIPQMERVKHFTKLAALKLGLEIHRAGEFGGDPFLDMRRLTPATRPVIFDVGANLGQSVRLFRWHFARPIIHCFEPGRHAFQKLHHKTTKIPDLVVNNMALGSESCSAVFTENTSSEMSSFLKLGPDGWGKTTNCMVDVGTLDDYCVHNSIRVVDILKIDTQGFELQVLRGGEKLIAQHRIGLIFLEITFSKMYESLPRLDEIYRYLVDRGFSLVTFYRFCYQRGRAGWTDALFAAETKLGAPGP
jgi:FkbM family methyltransferase